MIKFEKGFLQNEKGFLQKYQFELGKTKKRCSNLLQKTKKIRLFNNLGLIT